MKSEYTLRGGLSQPCQREGLSMPNRPRDLSVEEIIEAAEAFKDDLIREMRRAARQHTDDSKYEAYACVKAEEVIEQFVYNLKILASSGLKEYLSRPARARPISLKALK